MADKTYVAQAGLPLWLQVKEVFVMGAEVPGFNLLSSSPQWPCTCVFFQSYIVHTRNVSLNAALS